MSTAVLEKTNQGRDGTVACGASAPQDTSCPLVSIVVPVWNVRELLPACLDSIRAQTMPDWECILVDDGTTDGSGQICDEYAARDSRFVVIHKENGGVCAARNTGIRAARGRYLTFSDDDDRLHPRLLEWAADAMQAVPEGFVSWRYTRNLNEFATGSETGQWRTYRYDGSYFILNVIGWTQWNHLYDRQRVRDLDVWFDEDWYRNPAHRDSEDRDFFLRLMEAWQAQQPKIPVAVIDNRLYCWVQNEQSITGQSSRVPASPPAGPEKEPPARGRWQTAYRQMADHQVLYPDGGRIWPQDAAFLRRFHLRSLADALCCAKANKEKTPPLGRCKELTALLNSCKMEKIWSPYYLPFRLRQKWLIRLLHRLDEDGSRWFGRFDWGFYYLLGGNWSR